MVLFKVIVIFLYLFQRYLGWESDRLQNTIESLKIFRLYIECKNIYFGEVKGPSKVGRREGFKIKSKVYTSEIILKDEINIFTVPTKKHMGVVNKR